MSFPYSGMQYKTPHCIFCCLFNTCQSVTVHLCLSWPWHFWIVLVSYFCRLSLILSLSDFLNNFIYLFFSFFGCVQSSVLHGLLFSCGEWGLFSSCAAWACRCGDFSCRGPQVLGVWASVVLVHGLSICSYQSLESRIGSYGAWT